MIRTILDLGANFRPSSKSAVRMWVTPSVMLTVTGSPNQRSAW
jgi:hypothetical protein